MELKEDERTFDTKKECLQEQIDHVDKCIKNELKDLNDAVVSCYRNLAWYKKFKKELTNKLRNG